MELSTVLQARSVARQEGRPGVLSELYGVTNWDFDFIAESLLPGQNVGTESSCLRVGAMEVVTQ